MRLTAKIVAACMVAIVFLTALHGYLTVQREDRRLREEMAHSAQTAGRAWEQTVTLLWQERGHAGVVEWARRVSSEQGQQLSIRWLALDGRARDEEREVLERLKNMPRGQAIFTMTDLDTAGVPHQHVFYPVNVGEVRAGCLQFTEPLEDVRRFTRATIYRTVAIISGMLLSGLAVAVLGVRWVGRPLEQLVDKTERIGRGDFTGPLELKGHDELSNLAAALNRMSDQLAAQQAKIRDESQARLEAVEQLRHADRLKTVGRLASGAAHELGTPLHVISGYAELIASGELAADEVPQSAAAIKAEADRMANIIRQLLDFARRRTPECQEIDLKDLVAQATNLLSSLAERNGVHLQWQTEAPPLRVRVNAAQMQQVLTNLIVNAIQSMPEGGDVTISWRQSDVSPPDAAGECVSCCCLAVEDRGMGMDALTLQHIFEPFFTTKDPGEGTGLGLSVSYGIVKDHGGWMGVESRPGEGSRFTVYLPRH